MKAPFDFVIKPKGNRYNNTTKVGTSELILNTEVYNHQFVNRQAIVKSVPTAFESEIKPKDEVIVHHNIFRRYYNQKGKEVNSSKYFKDNTYFCQLDQIYMYGRNNLWKPFNGRCFVAPIINKDELELKKRKNHIGILRYGNSSLEALKINKGDVIGFTPNSEFEFVVNDELLYCMKSKDIVIKYEHKKNKAQYNPSWAKSS